MRRLLDTRRFRPDVAEHATFRGSELQLRPKGQRAAFSFCAVSPAQRGLGQARTRYGAMTITARRTVRRTVRRMMRQRVVALRAVTRSGQETALRRSAITDCPLPGTAFLIDTLPIRNASKPRACNIGARSNRHSPATLGTQILTPEYSPYVRHMKFLLQSPKRTPEICDGLVCK
jgi:hypothetical protein